MNCPTFVDLKFNHQFESLNGKSNSLECGSLVHKYLEVKYKSIINGMDKLKAHDMGMVAAELYVSGCPYCTDFIPTDEILKPKCNHPINEYPGLKNTQPESEGHYIGWKWALTTCEQYNEFYRNDSWVPLEVEVVKSKIIYEDEDVKVLWKAKLDWVVDTSDGIRAADHKTMKQNRSGTSLNNQFMGQNTVMDTQSMIVNKIGFQKTLKPEEKFKRELMNYDLDRLAEWRTVTVPYYAKLMLMYNESGYWPPNYTNCESKFGICHFAEVCSSARNMREDLLRSKFKVGQIWNPTNEPADE